MREMDPDVVIQEAEIGQSLVGDDALRGFCYVKGIGLKFCAFCFLELAA